MVVNYRAAHHDMVLGMPTVYGYNTHEWGGFLSYGHGYGLLQYDHTREYLLLLYSLMAHQYTRGLWTAPETRSFEPEHTAAPFCTPAQMAVPLLTRWMLVFEEPVTNLIWLDKATPRAWLQDGQTIAVTNAPTRWGRLSYTLHSHLRNGVIEAGADLPREAADVAFKLHLRAPEGHTIRSVVLNGKPWSQFDPKEETIDLPVGKRRVDLTVRY